MSESKQMSRTPSGSPKVEVDWREAINASRRAIKNLDTKVLSELRLNLEKQIRKNDGNSENESRLFLDVLNNPKPVDIRFIQGVLRNANFLGVNVDGILGPRTLNAMKLYVERKIGQTPSQTLVPNTVNSAALEN